MTFGVLSSSESMSKPVFPGIWISRKIRSGLTLSIRSTPSAALAASAITSISGKSSNNFFSSFLARRSSSIMMALIMRYFKLFASVDRDQNPGLYVISVNFADIEVSLCPKEDLQPVLRAGQAEPVDITAPVQCAGIDDYQFVVVLGEIRNDLHFSTIHLAADPVFDGVFDKGLEHHRGNGLIQCIFIDLIFYL